MIKICEFCGNEFEIIGDTPNNRRRKYCSDNCKKLVANQQKRKGRHNLVCSVCGKIFLSDRRDRVCCSVECGHERNKQLAKELFKKAYWDNKKEQEEAKVIYERPKRKKVTPAHEIEAEARKVGMNYGQYYALMLQKQEIEERERKKQIGE